MQQKDKSAEIEKRFNEVVDKVIQTAEAKGWETNILSVDKKHGNMHPFTLGVMQEVGLRVALILLLTME